MAILADGLDPVSVALLFAVDHRLEAHISAREMPSERMICTDGVPLILRTLSCVSSKLMYLDGGNKVMSV